ncbi:hypothetical protein CDAR_495731 [Caerostris darwini]|uniref:Uncharacterized protein n=1 Tax=Caerostris darwini TaxID=1538125 RepID=A0AAV4T4G2_9ARAC|nr:hypothetical protein CDAR_495731 [Caerostris darwini]
MKHNKIFAVQSTPHLLPTLWHQGTGNQSRVPIWSSGGVAIRGSLRVLISSPSIILWEPIRAPESRVGDISTDIGANGRLHRVEGRIGGDSAE